MIEIKNISKSFNGRQVLDNVSGTFNQGETTLVIGASGTGKSVLLKCMLDLVRPDVGTTLYDERNFYVGEEEDKKDIRREMGVLFQGGALFDSQTVQQNVQFPLDMLTKMGEGEKKDRVEFCLQRVGLEGTGSRMPSEISGGMKKRVGIARAIVMNPKYLFCDEPNSGLDPLTSVRIDDLIKEITDEFGITTIVITHDMNSVIGMGENEKKDRVAFCLQRVGLEGTGNRMPSEISGGMKKRVGIARAIVMNPKYLFCDEPNSGLDPLTSIKIDELIKEITDEFNITTVVITHDMNSVLSIGDKIMFLYKGQKIWEGNSQTILGETVPELEEFVFCNKALSLMRGNK